MKPRLWGAVCACLFASYLPSSSYASFILNPGLQPGGEVLPIFEGSGSTELDVTFTSMQSITIDFDPLALIDKLTIQNINNATGTPWTGIDFTFVNSTVQSPIGITPLTGLISGIFFDTGPFIPNVTRSVSLSFDPGSPEVDGLVDGIGDIDTSTGPYSLIITPSAVPIPAAGWLFGSGLLGLIGISKKKKAA